MRLREVRVVCWCYGWMVVRFVVVTRVPLCARVSCVRPVCVPAPLVSFYRYRGNGAKRVVFPY